MATLINDPVMGAIVTEILNEVQRSKAKHPTYPEDPVRRTGITMEEFLEAATCLQRATLQVGRVGTEEKYATLQDLKKELVHLAAMAVKQLEAMETEK
jgi:hypothetical protein